MNLKIEEAKDHTVIKLEGKIVAVLSTTSGKKWSLEESQTGGIYLTLNGGYLGTVWFDEGRLSGE